MKQKPIIDLTLIVVITGVGTEDENNRFSFIMRKSGMTLMRQ